MSADLSAYDCWSRIEAMEAEFDAADWCHPCGALAVKEWLFGAGSAADHGRLDDVHRLLKLARHKLDLEWWWWSRGGSDWPPDRPANERRPAVEWLPLDETCSRHAVEIAAEDARKSEIGMPGGTR